VIIRIMGEGQLELDDTAVEQLNVYDAKLEEAVNTGDEAEFSAALCALLGRARALGKPLPADAIEPSGLILPREDATIAEVRELLAEGGLIPG
jgi:PspA-Associated protein